MNPKLSIIVPVYYNEETLPQVFETLQGMQEKQGKEIEFEFVLVDDGSGDRSYELLQSFANREPRARVVKLARNFGSHTAVMAGVCYATGDCITGISADLQEPVELLIEMFREWEKGAPVVIATRRSRQESFLSIAFSNLYYGLMSRFSEVDFPRGGFDSFLIDRKVADVLRQSREKNTSVQGLILWSGFRRATVSYDRLPRMAGKSRWTLSKKIKLLIDSFIAFSHFPIRFVSMSGIIVACLGFLYAFAIIIDRIFLGGEVKGWASLMVVVLILSGLQLMGFGVLGEYLWRNIEESRKRPLFVVDETINIPAENKNGQHEVSPP